MFPLFLITIIGTVLTRLLTPTQKAGNLKDFTFPQINDGDPIYYMAGTNKITAPGMVWYGDYSTKAIKSGGFFGLFETTTGYKYYLGWQLIFCLGPGVRLQNLWFGVNAEPKLAPNGTQTIEQYREENNPNFTSPNDPKVPTPILSGNFTTFQNKYLENKDAFGGDTGAGGYELHVSFYSGDFDQPTDTLLQQKINGFIPPYRGLCHIVADGYIGNTTQLQPMTAELTRIYDPLALGAMATIGTEGDANPANVIYELLTNNFGAASIPLPKMNNDSFISAGTTFFNEDEGISILSNSSPTAINQVLKDILRQVDGVLYEDPNDGTIHLGLIRDDYDVTTLLELDESNILSVSNFTTNLWSDTKNRIRLKFMDRLKDYDDRVAVAEDMANVSFQDGQVKGINIEHPYIKRVAHANRKAADELAIYSTPLTKVALASQRISISLRPASVIKMTYGPYKLQQLVLRVTSVSYGDLINNHLIFDLVQDKFSKTDSIFAAPVNYYAKPYTGAISVAAFDLVESPRFFNAQLQTGTDSPDNGRFMAYVYSPAVTQQGYNEWVKEDDEADFVQVLTNQPFADLAAIGSSYLQASDADIVLSGISDPTILTIATEADIQQGSNLILIDDEIMSYAMYSVDTTGTIYTLQGIERALLDTVRENHAAGAYVVFLAASAVSQREFAPAATVDLLFGSVASGGVQDITTATAASLALTSRALRPYAPASVKLDGIALNPSVDNTNGVAVTFARRDRLKTTVSFESDPDEVPESGTEYYALVTASGIATVHDLGATASSTLVFDFAGQNDVQIYSELNGFKSAVIEFTTMVAHGAGVAINTPMPPAATTVAITGVQLSILDGQLGTATTVAVMGTANASSDDANVTGALGSPAITDTIVGSTGSTYANPGDQAGGHNYWRIKMTGAPDGGNAFAFSEMVMKQVDGTVNVPDGSAFADQTYGGQTGPYAPSNAFDGDTSTLWSSSNGALQQTFGFQFAYKAVVHEIDITAREDGTNYNQAPTTFDVQYSDDGTTWSNAWSATTIPWTAEGQINSYVKPAEVDIAFDASLGPPATTSALSGYGLVDQPGGHNYWRIRMTTGTPDGEFSIVEMKMLQAPGGTANAMIGTAFADSGQTYLGLSGPYTPAKAFDGDLTTFWASNTDVVPQNFGFQFEYKAVVNEIDITVRSDGTYYRQGPTSFDVQYSDDGTNYTTLWSVVGTDQPWTTPGQTNAYANPTFTGTASAGLGTATTAPVDGTVTDHIIYTSGNYRLIDASGNYLVDASDDALVYQFLPNLADAAGNILVDASGNALASN